MWLCASQDGERHFWLPGIHTPQSSSQALYHRVCIYTYIYIYISGQIIATSDDLTPNGALGREISFFHGSLGWWNIIICPDILYVCLYICFIFIPHLSRIPSTSNLPSFSAAQGQMFLLNYLLDRMIRWLTSSVSWLRFDPLKFFFIQKHLVSTQKKKQWRVCVKVWKDGSIQMSLFVAHHILGIVEVSGTLGFFWCWGLTSRWGLTLTSTRSTASHGFTFSLSLQKPSVHTTKTHCDESRVNQGEPFLPFLLCKL